MFLRIKTEWDFIAVRRAGIALAREVERRAPDAVTTSWWKEERGKRIFIDFNQNARDRTFASAYSVRRTAIATVSTPLTWEELASADPDDYTMATVPDLVARREDPWADMDSVDQSIAPLLEMAAADEERGLGDLPYPPELPEDAGGAETGSAVEGYRPEEGEEESLRRCPNRRRAPRPGCSVGKQRRSGRLPEWPRHPGRSADTVVLSQPARSRDHRASVPAIAAGTTTGRPYRSDGEAVRRRPPRPHRGLHRM